MKAVAAIRQMLDEKKTIVLTAHSQGALILENALAFLTPEQRQCIPVRTFGAARIIRPEGLASAINYISDRDPVPFPFLADGYNVIKALWNGESHVQLLRAEKRFSLFDHSFSGAAYQDALHDSVNKLKRELCKK